ncbi:pep-cterm sorting domain-containing protein [Anaeramoeba flamelloides]|uniref:Pep-cterm sorting domain-containing protein n=1 Tax=Anaeramoeba flamelloides TaxID=1746091 RepID=A0AAV7ZZ62_9EUKA|nr:pep-cterm sorting domain-containing protein [Anaeramoeba flamelloides]
MSLVRLQTKLKKLQNSSEFSDVQLIIGSTKTNFYAHKLLLSLNSTVFQTLFYGQNWKEVDGKKVSVVSLPDVSAKAFEHLINFCYTQQINIPHDLLWDVLSLSDKFQINDLSMLISKQILQKVTVNDCLLVLDRSVTARYSELTKNTLSFVVKNCGVVLTRLGCLNNLHTGTINLILESNSIWVPEFEIYKRLKERHNYKISNFLKQKSNFQNDLKFTNQFSLLKLSLKKELEKIRKELLPSYVDFDLNSVSHLTTTLLSHQKCLSSDLENKPKTRNEKAEENPNFKVTPKALKTKYFSTRRSDKPNKDLNIALLTTEKDQIRINDLIKTLTHETGISNVVVIDISSKRQMNKQLDEKSLSKYDCVIVFSPSKKIGAPILLGFLLEKYVQDGGGLVISSVCALILGAKGQLKGNIIKSNFLPVKMSKYLISGTPSSSKNWIIPNHPIINGVKHFHGGLRSHHVQVEGVKNNSNLIANWNDGSVLIAEKKNSDNGGIVVILNMFLVSNSHDDQEGWNSNTDGAKIIVNAVKYASQL